MHPFDFHSVHLDEAGRIAELRPGRGLYFPLEIEDGIGIDMVAIGPQRYTMGAAADEAGCGPYECTRHYVATPVFAIARAPVTQAQWEAVSRLPAVDRELAARPSYFDGGSHPVECISWLEAAEFCARLSDHTGRACRLPSEAEWEAACRAGSVTPFHSGPTITSAYANYIGVESYLDEVAGEYRRSTTPVGMFPPNALGLFDMHGNVWEWCSDHWHDEYRGAPRDGSAWHDQAGSGSRVVRGGAWSDHPDRLRSASRSGYAESALNRIIGMRLAVTL